MLRRFAVAWCVAVAMVMVIGSAAFAEDIGGVGGFDANTDIGPVKFPGTVAYNPLDQRYTITGSGTNMWAETDEFHFVHRKLTGDFILSCRAEFIGEGVDPHRKVGWLIRANLEPDAPYVDVALHGDGLMSMQFRRTKGAITEQIEAGFTGPDVLELERRGGKYLMRVAHHGQPFVEKELEGLDLGDEVYVGLFVCSHNADVVERAVFSNVRVTIPAAADFRPYRDYIGSRLELMEVETGLRRVLHVEPGSFQAPNWTLDGKALIYNKNGLIWRYVLATGAITQIDTGEVTRNNNDHVISFDGKMLGLSGTAAGQSGSKVWTVPIEGGTPKLITPVSPSYLHGFSPDGDWMVYTAERGDGNWDIYKKRSDGTGDEVRLTTDMALDDGSEYSPDGQWIYFISTRTGKMQLWRMRPDGAGQERISNDDWNNWFPHVSQDNATLLYIAYGPEIEPTDHPWYKHVTLRTMPADGGGFKVAAYFYGGQGSINVPSWSPDGKWAAFVSNTVVRE